MGRVLSPAYQLGVYASFCKEAALPPAVFDALGLREEEEEEGQSPSIFTPVSPTDIAMATAPVVGSTYLLGRMGLPTIGPGIGGAIRAAFGPLALPAYGLGELFGLGLGPLSDPAYRSGRKGYFSGLSDQVGRNVEAIGEAGREAREKYGPLGLPVQALHGILNPVSGSLYLLKNLKETFTGREGEERAKEAQVAVARVLGR
jgi:hypothetical protein